MYGTVTGFFERTAMGLAFQDSRRLRQRLGLVGHFGSCLFCLHHQNSTRAKLPWTSPDSSRVSQQRRQHRLGWFANDSMLCRARFFKIIHSVMRARREWYCLHSHFALIC